MVPMPAVLHPLGLHLRERRPTGVPRGVVLFIHGATIGSVLFDLPVPGYSMLQACANAGWWAFAVDLRGYARSPKPPAMDLPAMLCPPVCTASDAQTDIAATVDHLRRACGVDKLSLVGGSWGSITAATYAASRPEHIDKLALLAPLYGTRNPAWLATLQDPNAPGQINPTLGGYRLVREADLLSRWDPEIPAHQRSTRRDPDVLRALLNSELNADPNSGDKEAFRVPNGTLHDLFKVFSGQPVYAAEAITMPCLLVRGADDQTSTLEDARLLYRRIASPHKQHLTIADAGHFLQAEHDAPLLHQALLQFLAYDIMQAATPALV